MVENTAGFIFVAGCWSGRCNFEHQFNCAYGDQPGNLPIAYFGSVTRIGPVGTGMPLVNSQARLTGFKLDTLGSLIPSASRAAAGATGFDADLVLALDTVSISSWKEHRGKCT